MAEITKGDRKVLVLLLVLVVGLLVYLAIGGAKVEQRPSALPQVVHDTIYVATQQNLPDTLSKEEPLKEAAPIRTTRYPGPPSRAQYAKKLAPGATIDQ